MVDLANQVGWEEDGPETLNQDLARCIVYGYKDAAKSFQGIDTEEHIKSLIKCLKDELKRNFKQDQTRGLNSLLFYFWKINLENYYDY